MPAVGYRGNGIMRAICRLAGAIAELAMMGSASAPHVQETKLLVPNVTVTAPAAPVEPPYLPILEVA
jgi:hypothetical protein